MTHQSILTFLLVTVVSSACAGDDATLKSDKDKISYTIGYQIGQSMKRDGLEIETSVVKKAMDDAMNDKQPALSTQEMQAAMLAQRERQQKQRERQQKQRQAKAETNLKAGNAFLDKNKKKKGVIALPSGLQYRILKKGNGGKPKPTDTVSVHYRGTLINGEEFDSSYKRGEPATFRANGVIKGWQEALQLMPTGSKWQIFVPAELGYGSHGAGASIGPNATLIFEIELLEIQSAGGTG
jgi:FKBP-type peptidyl-prolyl cis-trans isomerase FklB